MKPLARTKDKKNIEKVPKGPFHYNGLVRIYTPDDENSLLRAILNAAFKPYRIGIKDGKPFDRDKAIKELRASLAEKLSSPMEASGTTYYEHLSKGEYKKLASKQPEYSLENMKKYLESNNPLGLQFVEFISDALDFDIYIIDLIKLDVQNLSKSEDYYRFKNRNSVVLGMIDEHFETLGIKPHRGLKSFFSAKAPFIKAIWDRKKGTGKLREDSYRRKPHQKTPEREPHKYRGNRTPERERNSHRIKYTPSPRRNRESNRESPVRRSDKYESPRREESRDNRKRESPRRESNREISRRENARAESPRREESKDNRKRESPKRESNHESSRRGETRDNRRYENSKKEEPRDDKRRESPRRESNKNPEKSPIERSPEKMHLKSSVTENRERKVESLKHESERQEFQKKPISNTDPSVNKLTQRNSPKRESRVSPPESPRERTVYAKNSK